MLDEVYPEDHTSANEPQGHKRGKRPPSMSIERWCLNGPFNKKEELWSQLDRYNELKYKCERANYIAIPLEDVARWFGLSVTELNKEMTSPAFSKYCMAVTKIAGQMEIRHHNKLASDKLEELAKKNPKQYLMELNRFQKSLGFDDIKTEDIDELRKDEGPEAIKELAEILTALNGGVLPPIQRVLPLVLNYAGGTKTSTGEDVEENGFGHKAVEELVEDRPIADVGSSRRSGTGNGVSEEDGDNRSGEQMG